MIGMLLEAVLAAYDQPTGVFDVETTAMDRGFDSTSLDLSAESYLTLFGASRTL